MSDHPGNRLAPSYIADRQRRALCLAYEQGADVFRADGAKKRRWVYPAPNEVMSAKSPGYLRGAARFDARLRNWTTENVFGRSLLASATLPFQHRMTPKGWPEKIERWILGEDGGMDGQGATLRRWHAEAFRRKLFAGVHFGRARAPEGGRATWEYVPADLVLFWRLEDGPDGQIVKELVLEGVNAEGFLTRTVLGHEGRGVEWAEFPSKTVAAEDPLRYVYPPSESKAMELELPKEPATSGRMVGVSSVPIVAFQMSWGCAFRAPAPFSDAAELQLKVDRGESHLEDYATRKSASPVFVASGLGVDENNLPRKMESAGAVVTMPGDGEGDWRYIDSQHIPQEVERLEKAKQSIRSATGDPLREQYRGDATAAETVAGDVRSMSWLDLSMQADVGPLTRLLQWTCELEGLGAPEDAALEAPRSKTAAERHATVDRWAGFAEKGLITKEQFLAIAEEHDEDIGPDLWEQLRKMAAEEPTTTPGEGEEP